MAVTNVAVPAGRSDAPRRETRPLEPGEIFLCVHYPACRRGAAWLIAGTSFCAAHARMEGVQ